MSEESSPLAEAVLGALQSRRISSRAQLCKDLHLAPSTISGIVTKLISQGKICEYGDGTSTGGRRPRLLKLRDCDYFFGAADLALGEARLGLSQSLEHLDHVTTIKLDLTEGPSVVLPQIVAALNELATQNGGKLGGIGLCVPGPVQAGSGIVVGPSRMPGWNGANLLEILGKLTKIPALADNDARCAARGEYHMRSLQNPDNQPESFIYLKAGSAIGGCFMDGGQIYPGFDGLAGDVTHVRVVTKDPIPCSCGSRGCLETVASGVAIRKTLRTQGRDYPSTTQLVHVAREGDPLALAAIRDSGEYIGRALSSLVTFLNPAAVIVGGSMSSVPTFLSGIKAGICDYCLPPLLGSLSIQNALTGADSQLWGLIYDYYTRALSEISPTALTLAPRRLA